MHPRWSMRGVFVIALVVLGALVSQAATVSLTWNPVVGAITYRIYASGDQGVTWAQVAEVPGPTAQIVAPNAGLILYRASAMNAQGETIRMEFGAWYNGTWLPVPPPAGLGIQ